MVTLARAQRWKSPLGLALPLAPAVAVAGGALIALLFFSMPAALLEDLIVAGGLSTMVGATEPPLGATARTALALLLGGGFTASTWFGLTLFDGVRPKAAEMLRRGDIHPDGPPRPPLFAARDLGTPFLDVKAPAETAAAVIFDPVERPLPRDLDQPMAGFDPGALLAAPWPAAEPVAPLATALARPALIDPGDRIETFELTPLLQISPGTCGLAAAPASITRPVVAPATEATVHDLLARLERGFTQKAEPAPELGDIPAGSPADILGDQSRLATAAR